MADTTQTPPVLTPMMAQYLEIKGRYPDAILFYRMGDFYEMFGDDAIKAAPVLEVQLTSRDRNAENPLAMCGVPHHSATVYLQKLLQHGFKVALCEQMEDPATAKGIVRRDVTRVLTPALVGDPDLVPEDEHQWLLCVAASDEEEFDVSLLDLLAGRLHQGKVSGLKTLIDLLLRNYPQELLIEIPTEDRVWARTLSQWFPKTTVTVRKDYFENNCSLTALKSYLKETQKISDLSYLGNPSKLAFDEYLEMDHTTLCSLEVIRGQGQKDSPSLFSILDQTKTPMGRRLLKDWLSRPLKHADQINARLDAVERLTERAQLSSELLASLSQIRDLERLTSKTALGLAMPRDLVAIREILKRLPDVITRLKSTSAKRLKAIAKTLDPLTELTEHLERALEDEAPALYREGNIFRPTYHPDIAELRSLSQDAKATIAAMEAREKERTGIPSLKLKYSRVFGYTIEITKSYLSRVPPEYIRKQTIANGERFITEELKDFESKVVTAEHKLKALEEGLYLSLRQEVAKSASQLLMNARLLGEIDVLLGFAQTARERAYIRPQVSDEERLDIQDGRHPVIETLLAPGKFVPNSLTLSEEECQTLIITGPNMAGKSTIMRQAALIIVMAHCGSFVPAGFAQIPLTDAIFTRIGSSDDLARGRSTFMVEMTEVARILEKATPRSFIVIDEIGRGTSTYDGLSLAWSLLEYLHKEIRAKTLFATHFQEITQLEQSLPLLKNANVLVEKWEDEIVFLHKMAPGICNQSYGIQVARLAGLPPKVLLRAKEVLGYLETHSQRGNRTRQKALNIHDNQLVFFDDPKPPENRSPLDS